MMKHNMIQKAFYRFSFLGLSVALLGSCQSADTNLQTTDAVLASADLTGTYEFVGDLPNSQVTWEGYKFIGGSHYGFVQFKDAVFYVDDAVKLKSGHFVVDMQSISVKDLEPGDYNDKLVAHLKNDDFFSVDSFPIAAFEITHVDYVDGEFNVQVEGNLTIKDVTKAVAFPAKLSVMDNKLDFQASFTIDRVEWNIMYNSAKNSTFDIEKLKEWAIKDEVFLQVHLTANKS
jgi:polyisoprenoid-binding protein YceI